VLVLGYLGRPRSLEGKSPKYECHRKSGLKEPRPSHTPGGSVGAVSKKSPAGAGLRIRG